MTFDNDEIPPVGDIGDVGDASGGGNGGGGGGGIEGGLSDLFISLNDDGFVEFVLFVDVERINASEERG